MGLLLEIKDICDELNILKSLVEDQERVWRQASEVIGGSSSAFKNCLPSQVKRDITAMIQDAEVVQKSIHTLAKAGQPDRSKIRKAAGTGYGETDRHDRRVSRGDYSFC
jgi:hypothetical protein